MIQVVDLTQGLEPAYAALVSRDPRSMIYATLEFRTFLQQVVPGVPRYLVACAGGEVLGALPTFTAHDAQWGDVTNSLPWYGSYGGCIVRPDCGAEVRSALLRAFSEHASSASTAFSTVILSPHEQPMVAEYLDALRPQSTDKRIGQITTLPAPGPEIELRLQQLLRQKTRNLVRKALKQGFELSVSDDEHAWQFLHATHTENIAALGGRPKPWEHFAAVRSAIPADWRRLYVATLNGKPVAALLTLRFNRTIEYLTPVVLQEFRSLQPLSFAIWHAMLDAVRDGFRWWNWGGTWLSQHSLHHFKAGWGAMDLPYTYLTTARSEALAAFRRDREGLMRAFPYYFVFPAQSAS